MRALDAESAGGSLALRFAAWQAAARFIYWFYQSTQAAAQAEQRQFVLIPDFIRCVPTSRMAVGCTHVGIAACAQG